MFPADHARYFDSEIMFDENKALRQENQSMINIIDCLADKQSLQHTFWQMNWKFFQLARVTDNVPAAYKGFGFADAANTADDYSYDANGNMIKDNIKILPPLPTTI